MMDTSEDLEKQNIFEQNKIHIISSECLTKLIHEVKYIQTFINNLGFLLFGRDMIFVKPTIVTSPNHILDSAARTLQSIKVCCEYGNIADANTLLRKYRDDLFFYLYVILVGRNCNVLSKEKLNKHEENIRKWISNSLVNLNIAEILKYIGQSPNLCEAIKKYNLKESFSKIGTELNNFVHANGISFYNRSYTQYNQTDIQKITDKFIYNISYISIIFVFLLTLINGKLIMSEDYIDSLDCGITPEEESQNWVAYFVQEFIRKKKHLIDNNCINYLKDKTGMEI